ncbi:GNAT family N-acetyltransferase [Paenibacillus alkalitolerans]|uniref:GNAT family N-acetyltransferase n=1 Tax=Paenibacillus alkalitolerans TaxID=2799335 RepID=UPI0018F3E597|nr:GNAT family N-acetyltransferase [Paenibacillus alkalitolerans]
MNNDQIEIILGRENDKPIFRNLMQLYKYDTSDYTLEDPSSFGLYEYRYLDHYWTPHGIHEEGRKAYLIKLQGQLAGFVLVNNHSLKNSINQPVMSIAEFFVMRKWRRYGVGRFVAYHIFDTFDGEWEVKQEKENRTAQIFWESIINEYTNGKYIRLESHEPEWDGPVIRFRKEIE